MRPWTASARSSSTQSEVSQRKKKKNGIQKMNSPFQANGPDFQSHASPPSSNIVVHKIVKYPYARWNGESGEA